MIQKGSRYKMRKKGMDSMKKKSLKNKNKGMHKMSDGSMMSNSEMQPMEVMPKGFSKARKMAAGGAVSRGMGRARGGGFKYC